MDVRALDFGVDGLRVHVRIRNLPSIPKGPPSTATKDFQRVYYIRQESDINPSSYLLEERGFRSGREKGA